MGFIGSNFLHLMEWWVGRINTHPKYDEYTTRYGAGKYNKVARFRLVGTKMSVTYHLGNRDKRLERLGENVRPDIVVWVQHPQVLFDLLAGFKELERRDDGTIVLERFGFREAYASDGLIFTNAEGHETSYLNDLHHFGGRMWQDIQDDFLPIIEKMDSKKAATIRVIREYESKRQDSGVLRKAPFLIIPEHEINGR